MRRRGSFALATALGVATALSAGGAQASAEPAASPLAARTYYVDQSAGNDSAAGTSTGTAWKSLTKVASADLKPGDSVLFKRGQSWTGQLNLTRSGTESARITVGAYGSGARPVIKGHNDACVNLAGDYLRVTGLQVGVAQNAGRCSWAGVSVTGDHNQVVDNHVTGAAAGVFIAPEADSTEVTSNELVDNNHMSVNDEKPDNDSGAFGILLQGNNSTISWNLISGSIARSYDYGLDGAAIEIFYASHNYIHHNTSIDNESFTELGTWSDDPDGISTDNYFEYNAIYGDQTRGGLITRGAEDPNGPVFNTVFRNNSLRLGNAEAEGVVCYAGCTNEHLSMSQNIVYAAGKVGYADDTFTASDHNVFSGGQVQFRTGTGDTVADPRYVSATDLHLQAGSPAINRGVRQYWATDLDDKPTGVGGAVDAGAYERQ
ncbi:choice-of-anchor Q domain-containing protein [Goodfellowiella coeruleoviolacea]|uniref:Right handed beta helix region n=1 Tax=Goodfellowiella coeruleoviolacea TaxID=334858 RepID=A0AAE3KK42_9PSEU|nr:choice-of-anchor Q domain-containing protein [Goodfellowiella coeruleoviolacea]MCP2165038.1 Right handed beta helix region [Goodfellowiella coeruleoviolacea]